MNTSNHAGRPLTERNRPQPTLISLLVTLLLLVTAGCRPMTLHSKPIPGTGRLMESAFMTADAVKLPLSRWPVSDPKAVIIALHGFNDYRRFFSSTAEYLQQQQIFSYAYDQRGFGESPNTGIWAGNDAYAQDLSEITSLIKAQHPGKPVYLLGESMGGAIVIDTMSRAEKPEVAGIILSAPAVWGRQTMPWYQTSLLWTLSHTLPWMTLTGKGLEVTPSDNIEMLKQLCRDPLVIKETRVDAIYGLTDLMDAALNSAEKLNANTLMLYGKKDEIVPAEPTILFAQKLLSQQHSHKTIAYYENGYHMLLRDLQAPLVWQDIAHWILNTCSDLPSGANQLSSKLLKPQPQNPMENLLIETPNGLNTVNHCG